MTDLTDRKFFKELDEEELENVSGGALVSMNSGSYTMVCPFCGTPFTITIGTAHDMSSHAVIGTCSGTYQGSKCNAHISLKSESWATFKRTGEEKDVQMTRNTI